MITSLQCWRIVAALTTLSIGARSLNSINLELETPGTTPLSALGTPNLDKYNGTYNLEVWESKDSGDCRYTLHFDFNVNEDSSPVGDPEFQGTCAPTDSTGNAPDGLPWHAHRRNWIKFPQYVYDTTGFDHVSLEWVPCGRAPAGFRKARFDLNFYTVSPEYRTYMICDEFKTPRVCQYNQTTHIGRSQFTLPRLAIDPQYLVNMPVRFQPDPEFPEAFKTEGLTHYDPRTAPKRTEDWNIPSFLMTTHDAAVVSWRGMIPQSAYKGKLNYTSSEYQFYVYQTMPLLPSNWSTYFDIKAQMMYVELEGSAGLCGSAFKRAKGEQEYGIVVEDDVSTKTIIGPDDNLIN